MALTINTNNGAIFAQRSLASTQASQQTSMQRLSSGLRINAAKDDAAGLAISDAMTSKIRGETVAIRNANDGISMMQTADGALGTITDNLQRMRDLATQSANSGALSAGDQDKLQTEFSQLQQEITRVIGATQFNGKNVLTGGLNAANFQVGAGTTANDSISVSIGGTGASSISSDVSANANITAATATADIGSTGAPSTAIDAIDNALKDIDTYRANIGAYQNRFSSAVSNLQSSIDNQTAARSRITDADFATETSNLSRSQVLQQAGMAMLSQANQSAQSVLSLLR